mgnify:CR=1 FL=1
MPITIRSAIPTDVHTILNFVRELAEYSREPGTVVTTDQRVADALFGPDPILHALVAEKDEEIVGVVTYFFTFSTWLGMPSLYFEDFLVRQSVRGTGIGRQMMTHLARIALKRGCGRMECSVYDWNTSSIGFYLKIGAVPQADQRVYRLTGDSLTMLAGEAMRETSRPSFSRSE